MSVYEIPDTINEALDLTDEEGEHDSSSVDKQQFTFEKKLEYYARKIKNLNAESKALDDEIKTLTQRRITVDNKAKRLKAFVQQQLESLNIKKIDAGIHAFRIQKNSAASVTITDKYALPSEWKETVIRETVRTAALGKWFLATGELTAARHRYPSRLAPPYQMKGTLCANLAPTAPYKRSPRYPLRVSRSL